MDFVKEIGFSDDDIKPELEPKEETLMAGSSGINQKSNKVDSTIPNNKEMMNFVHDIEFANDIKPKLEIKEEKLKTKGSNNMVDPIMPNDEELIDFVQDIEFSDNVEPKLEIKKEETLDI